MANRSLVIAMSLILQLSLNTATDGIANIDNELNKSLNNIELQYSNINIDTNEQYSDLHYIKPELDVLNIIEENKYIDDEKNHKRIIDPNNPMIALTFDDGPSKYTSDLLDVLNENNSVATFFVLGIQVNKYEDILVRIVEEGNQVGNHSYSHKKLTTLSHEELYEQIEETDKLIYETTYYKPFLVRPPYGTISEELLKSIQKPIINWSIDTRDWESRDTEKIIKSIVENVKDGDIILMHDIYESSLDAARIVIPELIQKGYQLVTVSELSEYKEIPLTAGESYYNMNKK